MAVLEDLVEAVAALRQEVAAVRAAVEAQERPGGLLTAKQAAEHLGMSEPTLSR